MSLSCKVSCPSPKRCYPSGLGLFEKAKLARCSAQGGRDYNGCSEWIAASPARLGEVLFPVLISAVSNTGCAMKELAVHHHRDALYFFMALSTD